jgi:hypothetical protein
MEYSGSRYAVASRWLGQGADPNLMVLMSWWGTVLMATAVVLNDLIISGGLEWKRSGGIGHTSNHSARRLRQGMDRTERRSGCRRRELVAEGRS